AVYHYIENHVSKKQKLEYQNQLMKEITVGIVIETDNIRIFNQTFELFPRVLQKQKMEPATTLFILPKCSLDQFRTLVPTIISQTDLEKVELIFGKGKSLEDLNLELLYGKLSAFLLANIQLENSYIENWHNLLDLINKYYNK
ncbi:MAG: hypothetical protein EZS28_035320, partial [Streblomastix strix]